MHGKGHTTEKPKNLGNAMKSLSIYCKRELPVMIIAIILAIIGAIMMIMGPNQISKITDYIFDGLTGGFNMEDVAADIQKQMQNGEINPMELMAYLPEGTDLESIDFSEISFSDTEDPVAEAILENITLSDEYIENHKNEGIDLDAILNVATILLAIYLISAICTFIQHYMMATVTQKISKRMRRDIDYKMNCLPFKYFSKHSYGDVLSRITNDVDLVGQGLNSSAAQLVTAVASFIGCLLMMFITNWILALTTVLTSLLGIIAMGIIMKNSQKYFDARQKSLGELNGYIEEMYSGHNVVRICNAVKNISKKFGKLNSEVKDANFKSQFLTGLMFPVTNFVGNLGYVAVCIVGALLVINEQTTFGVITAFLIYVRLFEQPLKQISQNMASVQSVGAAAERVFEFLGEEELEDETYKTTKIGNITGNVEFKNVKFAYPSNPDKEIIHDFSANIKSGQKVAIVGPTGAGKTTLVNLLMRFFEINSGSISIDGIDTKDLKREDLHNLFGMVLQDTWIFEGTVRENLVFNGNNVDDSTMQVATKACGIHNFINALPNGYDTVLNDNTTISIGQKQLFTIARAMIQNSPMMILDEATSSVDTRTELITQKAMDELTEGRTSFVIAHRLSTIKNADVIFVMKDGDIVEQGNHDELMKNKGFYEELYNSQFEDSEKQVAN